MFFCCFVGRLFGVYWDGLVWLVGRFRSFYSEELFWLRMAEAMFHTPGIELLKAHEG